MIGIRKRVLSQAKWHVFGVCWGFIGRWERPGCFYDTQDFVYDLLGRSEIFGLGIWLREESPGYSNYLAVKWGVTHTRCIYPNFALQYRNLHHRSPDLPTLPALTSVKLVELQLLMPMLHTKW